LRNDCVFASRMEARPGRKTAWARASRTWRPGRTTNLAASPYSLGTILAARRSTSGCAKRINPRVVGEKTRRAIEEASDEELLLLPWSVWGEGVMGKVLGDFFFAIWDASHQTLPSKNRCGSSNPARFWKTTGNCSGQAVGDRLPGGKVSFSLSGGLDSGSVCATAARIAKATGNSEGLKAFTISWRPLFEDPEPEFAKLTAKNLGLAHEIRFASIGSDQAAVPPDAQVWSGRMKGFGQSLRGKFDSWKKGGPALNHSEPGRCVCSGTKCGCVQKERALRRLSAPATPPKA
jgi:hypothetical protein